MPKEDYTTIENPYNSYLERTISSNDRNLFSFGSEKTPDNLSFENTMDPNSSNSVNPNGSVETQPVKNNGGMGDIWITNFIRSVNWKPRKVGFAIDGQTGYAEFTNVFVSGSIEALSGSIGGWTIGSNELYATTTGTIKTSATVGAGSNGVILDKDGLRVYDSVLGEVVNLPSDGSAPTFSSGVINETTFEISTNAVLRTSSTVGDGTANSAGILINNTGLYACEASQLLAAANVRILIDGTGYFSGTISGSTIIGGTIKTVDATTQRVVIDSSNNTISFYNNSNNVVAQLGGGTEIASALRITLDSSTAVGVKTISSNANDVGYRFDNSGNYDSTGFYVGLTGSTNTGTGFYVDHAGSTGEGVYVNLTGNANGVYINRGSGTGTAAMFKILDTLTTSGQLLLIQKTSSTGSGNVAVIENSGQGISFHVDASHSTAANPALKITSASSNASGPALLIDKNSSQYAIDIDQDANDGNNTIGIRMNIANNGAGTKFAFEFSGGEYIASATSVSTITGAIRILTSDGTVYIPAYSSVS